tara:strand:- start:150 stop:521 length:372 start_codon:yes stop_codon:yes gene_type:complete
MTDFISRLTLSHLLRAEAAGAATLGVWTYHWLGGPWTLFALLLLAPDVSMLGYLRGPRAGAIVYNLGHSYLAPLALAALALALSSQPLVLGALVWGVHIALDRVIGAGLKHATGFARTHLSPA